MSTKAYHRAFFGGEITPELLGHISAPQYENGLAVCQNFEVLPHGPVRNRAGFALVREVKDSTKRTRLIPFTYSDSQTYAIELSPGFFRFHALGGTVLNAGNPVEVTNSYAEADLFDIHYTQSGDVLTLVHPNYPPAELRRTGASTWTFASITFAQPSTPISSLTATATTAASPSGLTTQSYIAVKVFPDGESAISNTATCSNNLLQTGAFNTIAWSPLTFPWGGGRVRVFKERNGIFGYIGESTGNGFVDDNITPDLSRTPSINDSPMGSAGYYPGAVAYYEQRRVFAGSTNEPQTVRATRPGSETNLSYSFPSQDADALAFNLAARVRATVRHLVPMSSLLALTSAGSWRVFSNQADALTPSNINAKPQGYLGANNVQPVTYDTAVLYATAKGGRIRELGFSTEAGGYDGEDVCIRAPHLFDGLKVVDMALAQTPHPVLWAVSSSGRLLGLTYLPKQEVRAWHRHTTAGTFESVCVISEDERDWLYAVVRRTINGQTKRFVERMAQQSNTLADAFHVDCGLTYTGAAATTISGLGHLEGATVAILADGAVHPPRVVTGGQVVLEQAASKVHVGLPIADAYIELLPFAAQTDPAFAQARTKNVSKMWAKVDTSGGLWAGPNLGMLIEQPLRRAELLGDGPDARTETVELAIEGTWQQDGRAIIAARDPLPLKVVAVSLEVALGG